MAKDTGTRTQNRPLYDAPRVKSNNPSKGPKYPDKTTQRANFNRMETEGRVGMRAYSIKAKKVDPKFQKDTNDEAIDLPMPRESSPIVTDTETGEVTYGKPKNFEHGGMASCKGMGKAIKGGKFIGVK